MSESRQTGWQLETGPEFRAWLGGLPPRARPTVSAAIKELNASGPKPPSTLVKRIKSSRHAELHELRAAGSNIRILFAIPEKNRARGVLLLGGDKTNAWHSWYDDNVPIADGYFNRYRNDRHTRGGVSQWQVLTLGNRSATLSR